MSAAEPIPIIDIDSHFTEPADLRRDRPRQPVAPQLQRRHGAISARDPVPAAPLIDMPRLHAEGGQHRLQRRRLRAPGGLRTAQREDESRTHRLERAG